MERNSRMGHYFRSRLLPIIEENDNTPDFTVNNEQVGFKRHITTPILSPILELNENIELTVNITESEKTIAMYQIENAEPFLINQDNDNSKITDNNTVEAKKENINELNLIASDSSKTPQYNEDESVNQNTDFVFKVPSVPPPKKPLRQSISKPGSVFKHYRIKETVSELATIPEVMLTKSKLNEFIESNKNLVKKSDSAKSRYSATEDVDFKNLLAEIGKQLENQNIKAFKKPFESVSHSSKMSPLPRLEESEFDETADELNAHILYKEIFQINLERRFHISFNPENETDKVIILHCAIKDAHLPAVPSIIMKIPRAYPTANPIYDVPKEAYSGTDLFSNIRTAFLERMSKSPIRFSVFHVLNCWEMSIRQVCANNM